MGIYQGNVLISYRPLAVLSVLVYAHSLAYCILWYLLSIRYTFIAVVFYFQWAFFVYDLQQRLDDRRIFSTLDNPWRTYSVKWFCCCFCRVPCWHSYYITMFRLPKNQWFFVVSLLSLPLLWLYYTPKLERQKIHIFLIWRGAKNYGKALIFHNRVWVIIFDTNWKIQVINNVFTPYFYHLLYIIYY